MKSLDQMPRDLLRRVEKIDKAIESSKRDTLRLVGMTGKTTQLDVMAAHVGPERRLSRVRSGRGAPIGARFDITGDSVSVRATGPVPLVANPMPPHTIPKPGRRRKRLAIPGIGVRVSVEHPGTKGKDTWNVGRERAEPKIRTVVARRTDEAVRRAFRTGG